MQNVELNFKMPIFKIITSEKFDPLNLKKRNKSKDDASFEPIKTI